MMTRIWTFAFLLLTTLIPIATSQLCQGLVDLVFLVDDSESTKTDDPSNSDLVLYAPGVTSFLTSFVDQSALGDVRIGLVQFSHTARVLSPLESDASRLRSAISGMVPEYDESNAVLGLRRAMDMVTSSGRPGVPKKVVVLLDGCTVDARATMMEAAEVEGRGLDILALGFGPNVPVSELVGLARHPAHYLRVPSHLSLPGAIGQIAATACPGASTATPPVPTQPALLGLCAECEYRNGMAHLPYPGDLARFLQCQLLGGGNFSQSQHWCPFGTLWDADKSSCEWPFLAAEDTCRSGADGDRRDYGMYCGAYWQCQGSVSEPKCCPPGQRFQLPQGCLSDPSCISYCPLNPLPPTVTSNPLQQCPLKESPRGPQFYRMFESPLIFWDKRCPDGLLFVSQSCGCHQRVVQGPNDCEATLDIPFNQYQALDVSPNQFMLDADHSLAFRDADNAAFDGKTIIVVPGLANMEFGSSFFLIVVFSPTADGSRQSLLHNAPCGDDAGPSVFLVSVDNGNGTFTIASLLYTTGDSVPTAHAFLVQAADMPVEVRMRYDGTTVTTQLFSQTTLLGEKSRSTSGPIRRRHGALNIGGGQCVGCNSFHGTVDFIKMFRCQPNADKLGETTALPPAPIRGNLLAADAAAVQVPVTVDAVTMATANIALVTATAATRAFMPGHLPSTTASPQDILAQCQYCNFFNGVGYTGLRGSCSRYVQCLVSGSGLNYTIRHCPFGTMWNDQATACDKPTNAACDPCRGHPEGTTFKIDLLCGAFWECRGGVAREACCPPGHAYVGGSGCRPDPSCKGCPPPSDKTAQQLIDNCPLKASSLGPDFYVDATGRDVKCPPNVQFVAMSCGCHQAVEGNASRSACHPYVDLRIEGGRVEDSSVNRFAVAPFLLSFPQPGIAEFNGVSNIQVPALSNARLSDFFELRVRFQASTSVIADRQVIVHNGPCNSPAGPSFRLALSDGAHGSLQVSFLLLVQSDASPTILTLNGTKSEWLETELSYDGKTVTATLIENGLPFVTSRPAQGAVVSRNGAMNIGDGQCSDSTPFVGRIDYVRLSTC